MITWIPMLGRTTSLPDSGHLTSMMHCSHTGHEATSLDDGVHPRHHDWTEIALGTRGGSGSSIGCLLTVTDDIRPLARTGGIPEMVWKTENINAHMDAHCPFPALSGCV